MRIGIARDCDDLGWYLGDHTRRAGERASERACVERAGAGIAFEELGEADVLSPLPSYNFIFCSSFPPHSPASNVLHFSFGLDSWARRVGCRDRLEQSRQGRADGQAGRHNGALHVCMASGWVFLSAVLSRGLQLWHVFLFVRRLFLLDSSMQLCFLWPPAPIFSFA